MKRHNYLSNPVALLACVSLPGCNAGHSEAARKDDIQKVMQLSVQKFDSVKEAKYPWGWIRWVMNSELDPAASQTFGIVEIEPGQRNPLHKHPNCEELLYVLSGSLENIVGGQRVVLHAGDILRIPADTPHQGINNSNQPMRAVIAYSSGTRQMVALESKTE